MLVGKAFVEIIREVLRNGRDLVIKSVDSSGSRLFGGTDMKLLRKCPCPVWMIQSTQQQGYREIVAAPECATALGAELVVMGTLGRTGITGFVIGNTAEQILNQIDCSVLAIKPAGFISPVTVDVSG